MGLENRLKKLESLKRENGKVNWIFYFSVSGRGMNNEKEPSDEELALAQSAYLERFGKPKSGCVILYCSHGVINVDGVELVRYGGKYLITV